MRDGLPNGEGVVWHPNGQIKSRGPYVNGLKHGVFSFYTEDGVFEHQALFWKNVEVWRSQVSTAQPPADLVRGLTAFSGGEPRLGADLGKEYEKVPQPPFHLSSDPPAPFFASLDRTTSLNRLGVQVGFSGANEMPFGSVSRIELFGNYRFSRVGVYGQISQPSLTPDHGPTLAGRRTVEVGSTYHSSLERIGGLTLRGGLVLPIGNDDADGYLAGTAASFQRPTDAVTSFPSSFALRSGASITHSRQRFVVQGDAGVDWLMAGESRPLDALLRANGGIGYGVRSGMLSLELTNTIRITEPSRRLHAIGAGGTFWINHMWITGLVSRSFDGHTALTGAMGYEL